MGTAILSSMPICLEASIAVTTSILKIATNIFKSEANKIINSEHIKKAIEPSRDLLRKSITPYFVLELVK